MNEKIPGDTPEGEVDINELKSQIATLSTEKENLVGELQSDRKKRQELADQITQLQEALQSSSRQNATKSQVTEDVETLVTEVLERKLEGDKASRAKGNKQAALEEFYKSHKEFSDEVDITGKRREALEAELNAFNTSGITEKEDFEKLVKKAHMLIGGNTTPATPEKEVKNPYSSIPTTTITPTADNTTKINDLEAKLIKQNGWDEERYLKLKAKNPVFIESLLQYVK